LSAILVTAWLLVVIFVCIYLGGPQIAAATWPWTYLFPSIWCLTRSCSWPIVLQSL